MSDNKAITKTEGTILPAHIQEAVQAYGDIVLFVNSGVMKPGVDYGVIPGTKKPSLWKPGAEKLTKLFKLYDVYELVSKVETWDQDGPFFHYQYRCRLIHRETGEIWGEGIGSCNSREEKYFFTAWKTVKGEVAKEDQETLKADGLGRWHKDNGSWEWQQRIPQAPTFTFGIVNTVDKMAQKRAYIAATLIACAVSEFFTQDIEDLPRNYITGEWEDVTETVAVAPPEPPASPAEQQVTSQPEPEAQRPYAPHILRSLMTVHVADFQGVNNKLDRKGVQKALIAWKGYFGGLADTEEKRHLVAKFLFGIGSFNDLDDAVCSAISWWVEDLQMARKECQLILSAFETGELWFEEPEPGEKAVA